MDQKDGKSKSKPGRGRSTVRVPDDERGGTRLEKGAPDKTRVVHSDEPNPLDG